MIKLSATGVGRVQAELVNWTDRVTNAAGKQLRRTGEKVVREAKINCPVDDGLLEDSIRMERVQQEGSRRMNIVITAGGGDGVIFNPDGRSIDLDRYAAIMHEHYEQFKPGKATMAKRGVYGDRVGGKFLERALLAEEPQLENHFLNAMWGIINTGGSN